VPAFYLLIAADHHARKDTESDELLDAPVPQT